MKIAMVCSEVVPFSKSGGLADVVYSLSKELIKKGEEVIIISPLYKESKAKPTYKFKKVASYDVKMAWRRQSASVFKTASDGITYYLIQNDYYFNRDHLYSYDDDNERFAFFSLASKEVFKRIKYKPDIIHIHDWQPGMLPTLIKEDKAATFFKNTKFILIKSGR